MKLKLVQHYYGGGQIKPPVCDHPECKNRAVRLWQSPEGKGLDLCGQHEPEISPEQVATFIAWQKPPANGVRPEILSEYQSEVAAD